MRGQFYGRQLGHVSGRLQGSSGALIANHLVRTVTRAQIVYKEYFLFFFYSALYYLGSITPFNLLSANIVNLNFPLILTMSLKSILITGTSAGGIGSALAFAFQRQGYLVFATARSPSKIDQELVNLSNVEVLTLDVTSASSIASAVEAVKTQTGGTLDVLLNNSGGGYLMPLVDLDLDAAKAVFEVNLWGLLATTKAFAPLLVKSKGTVVNISSIGGQFVQPFNGKRYIFHTQAHPH